MALKLFVAFALVLGPTVSSVAVAEAKKEEKKEEAKPTALPEWVSIQSKLQTLRATISAKDRSVRELIKAKEHEKDPRKSHDIIKNMKSEHADLRQAMEEYDRQLNLLRYRFPEKGLKEEQRYRRMNAKSIEELEKQVGMEGRLKAVTGKMKRQYGEPETAEDDVRAKKEEPADAGSEPITMPPVMSK